MKCPQCHYENKPGATECDSCAVVFRDTKRGRSTRSEGLAGQMCAWNDHGYGCPHKGIISNTVTGGGSWYCREHWESINDRTPSERGNAVPAQPRMRGHEQRDAWWQDWLARRDRRVLPQPIPREPGEDDEWSDLVPAEVGQA